MKNIIVIIGSGFGGIAAALRAKKKGFDVIIIERNKNIGGKAQIYKDNNYIFDAGPTVITAPYLFSELYKLFGKKIKNYINFIELKNWYNFYFFDKTKFNYYKNLKKTEKNIKKFSKKDIYGYKKLLLITKIFFDNCFKYFSIKPFNNFYQMIKCIPFFIKLKCYKSYFNLIKIFIKNNNLKQMFFIYPLLIGGNPYKLSCLYSLIIYLERKWGIHFPKGGIGFLINKLEILMREEGIKIYTGVTVKKIITYKKKAIAIKLNNNHYIKTNYIVSNIEPKYLYNKLINIKNNFLIKKKLSNKKYSFGLFILYFGTNYFYSNIYHHTILFNNNYYYSIKNIFYKKHFNKKNISIYLHHPTITDKLLKKSTFYALIPVPNLKYYKNWSRYENELFVQDIISILDSKLLPKLKKNIKTCFYITPKFFKKRYFNTFGSGFSISPNLNQIAWFRFHNKSELIKNLYLVGAGTHPGPGIPGVLLSAKLIDKFII